MSGQVLRRPVLPTIALAVTMAASLPGVHAAQWLQPTAIAPVRSSMQPVQWGLSAATGMRPEQLLLALRQRGMVASQHSECQQLVQDIQRLRRTLRRAAPEQHAPTLAELEAAQTRFTALQCASPKL